MLRHRRLLIIAGDGLTLAREPEHGARVIRGRFLRRQEESVEAPTSVMARMS